VYTAVLVPRWVGLEKATGPHEALEESAQLVVREVF
jgi:hypothetical protein